MKKLLVLLVLLCVAGCYTAPRTPRPLHSKLGAQVVCEKFVKARLKAPATAKFGGAYGNITVRGGGCYVVRGYVDAQNSFGALIRSNYVCTVCSTGKPSGSYTLEGLVIE